MSFLHQPGDLAQTPVAALLLEALNLGATGVLTVRHGGAESRVFLRDGVPVGAQTFAAFKPLGQVLLAARLIDMDVLARSLAEMARSGRPQGVVLVEMGAVTQEQVDRALSEQQAGYLTLIAGVGAGTWAFDGGAVPEWTRSIRIAPLRAVVQALEQPQAAALVDGALAPVRTPIALAPGYARLADAFGWSPAEGSLVERLQSLTALDDFFRDPGVSPARARAILAALLLFGLASGPGGAEAVPPTAVKDLAELAGETIDLELTPVDDEPEAPAAPAPDRDADARERRQRLLARAMQNLGIGPASRPPAPAAPPPTPASAPAPAPSPAARPGDAELRASLAAMIERARDPDPFVRLGVTRSATKDEVKGAYFQLAKRYHPDRFGAPELADLRRPVQDLFAALNEAYDVLSDDRRRAAFLAQSGAAAVPDVAAAALDFLKGEACLRTRDLRRARGFYEAAVRGDPRPEHLAALAWVLLQDPGVPERPRAQQLVTQALRDPRCARAAWVAGWIAKQDGNDVAAERHFRATLAADPSHADAQKELRAIDAKKARRDRPRD